MFDQFFLFLFSCLLMYHRDSHATFGLAAYRDSSHIIDFIIDLMMLYSAAIIHYYDAIL